VRACVRACVRVCVRARAGIRTGEGDRPTEIKSTSGRVRGETKVRVSVAAGKERRRRTRGRVTPECPRFLLSVPSLLSLARSVPLALTRVPQSSPSLSLPGPSLCLFHLLALGGLLPISLGYTISLFSLLPLSSPRTNGAHHLSSCRAPRYPARPTNVFLSIGTMENLSKIAHDCLGKESSLIEQKKMEKISRK